MLVAWFDQTFPVSYLVPRIPVADGDVRSQFLPVLLCTPRHGTCMITCDTLLLAIDHLIRRSKVYLGLRFYPRFG